MKRIKVTQDIISLAKDQITAFEQTDYGKWRYSGVESWKGVVCELLASEWLEYKFQNIADVSGAKGIDTSGNFDEYDLTINDLKVEIKAATKVWYKYIMPKVYTVRNHPKDIYVGCVYDDSVQPNEVIVKGYILKHDMLKYPTNKNKGAEYYEVPLNDLSEISKEMIYL